MFDPPGNTDAPQPCPHLGLASDPSTSCLFVVDSHCCFRSSIPKPVDGARQRAFCLSGKFTQCPTFSLSEAQASRNEASLRSESGGLMAALGDWLNRLLPRSTEGAWNWHGPALLASVIVTVAVGLLLFWVLPQVVGGRGQSVTPTVATPLPAASGPSASGASISTLTPTAFPSPSAVPAATSTAPANTSSVPTASQIAPPAVATQRPSAASSTPTRAASPIPTATLAPGAATPRPAASVTPGTSTPSPTRTTTISNGQRIYVVVAGDNLLRISESFGVSVQAIAQANNLPSENAIRVGQRLVIP